MNARRLLKRSVQSACSHAPLSSVLCWHGPRSSQQISFSFDDGPNAEYTPRVLDILREHGVRATFFVLGVRALRHPDLVRRIRDEGHEIGIHGWDHSRGDLQAQTERTAEALASLGIDTHLFRPPGGAWTPRLLAWMVRRRYATVLWSLDSLDAAREKGWDEGRLPPYQRLAGGDILLFHDDNEFCIAELPAVLHLAQSRRLVPTPLSAIVRR